MGADVELGVGAHDTSHRTALASQPVYALGGSSCSHPRARTHSTRESMIGLPPLSSISFEPERLKARRLARG